jgi:hypothetical protein
MRGSEAGAALATLVQAFARDPLAQWLHPDAEARRAAHTALFTPLLHQPHADALIEVTEDVSAVALWYRPGHVSKANPPEDAAAPAALFFAAIHDAAPREPHWYLAFLAARAPGGGGGSALLRHRLARAGGPVALWTGNPANRAFYARFGLVAGPPVSAGGATGWWLRGAGQGVER